MTSQVYYRKWRPGNFSELVGQEHVATTLRQAIKQDRVSHSYLFCGPRGSGKTTTARILAKAVNCLALQDDDPCNSCAVCLAISQGSFLDIIELDAASNRGIDEIRDIREKVNFSPAQGRRKVYIIDEAHMLTDQAANAFLKTLEEPPNHVIFVLCTTEVHKILPTIVSRCQRFDFRRIPPEQIYQRLLGIVDAEGVAAEPEALRLIARSASGSLRDAENLLEQLVVSSSSGVGLQQVEDLLGLGHGEQWLTLAQYLLSANTSGSLEVINQAAWDGTDLRQLHRQTLDLLRAAMFLKCGSGDVLDLPDHVIRELQGLVDQIPRDRTIASLKTWSAANLRMDAPSTLPLELAVVEICDDRAKAPISLPVTASNPTEQINPPPMPRSTNSGNTAPIPAASRQARPQPPVQPTPTQPAESSRAQRPAAAHAGPSGAGDSELAGHWLATVKALGRHKGKKYNLGALLRDCRADAISLSEETLVLAFANRANMERMQEEMDDPLGRRLVSEAIDQEFGRPYEVKLTLADGVGSSSTPARSAQNSALVRAAMGMGARILEEVEE